MNHLKTKRELAADLLSGFFEKERRVLIDAVVLAGAQIGVSKRTLQRAARDLGASPVHNGPCPAYWEINR